MSRERSTPPPIEEQQLIAPLRRKNKFGLTLAAVSLAPIAFLGVNTDKIDSICGEKSGILVPGYSDVFVAGAPPKNGIFDRATFFGCDPALGYKDDEDECEAVHQKQIPVCNEQNKPPLTGRDCQEKLLYFSANATQYLDDNELGTRDRLRSKFSLKDNKTMLHTKVKVTNTQNGNSVVVMPIDWGPGCQVQYRDNQTKFDLSYRAYKYAESGILFDEKGKGYIKTKNGNVYVEINENNPKQFPVKVEKVPDNTPLGPIIKK